MSRPLFDVDAILRGARLPRVTDNNRLERSKWEQQRRGACEAGQDDVGHREHSLMGDELGRALRHPRAQRREQGADRRGEGRSVPVAPPETAALLLGSSGGAVRE